MNRLNQVCAGLILLSAATAWSQTDSESSRPVPAIVGPELGSGNSDETSDRMETPPPVSGQPYTTNFASEERSNYLRGGIVFTSAYVDNAIAEVNGHPVSDISYSVTPTITLDETTPRTELYFTYAPGFTFYQRTSSLNQTDQNASIGFQYRLSPHVTFTARDSFQKTSSIFNQPDFSGTGSVSGGTQAPNTSVIAPIADLLRNSGNLGISYQFSPNSMVGASGSFSNLHYPNPAEVTGLFDSSSQGGSVFYSLRVSRMHYFGLTYQYQRLASYTTEGLNETRTQAGLLFYTLQPTARFSISVYAGPQYSDTVEPPNPPAQPLATTSKSWNPAIGGSASWQGRVTNIAASYTHIISGGGGLFGAVRMDNANASVRQRLTRTLNGFVMGAYTQNDIVGQALPGASSGHTLAGTASVQQLFGEHISLQVGYTRLHQDYSNIPVLSATPDTNREFISISYQFSKPLGR